MPPIEQKSTLNLPNVANAQIYANLIKTNLQFNPVDIINNEVISAGQTNGNPVLIHCRVNPGGALEFTVKSNAKELLDLVISTLLPDALGQQQ